jgi:phage shock protein E
MPSYRKKPVDVVIDVRSKLEFWLGHLDGAICIPVSQLTTAIAKREDITKDSRILVYCASGARSALAHSTLASLGYRRVTDGGAMAAARQEYSA